MESPAESEPGTVSLFRIVLLVSCAHALVHLLEQSIASVEQVVSQEFTLDKAQSGLLGSALRFPYGVGALFAGLLADRLGSRRVLVIYLFGAALVCASFLGTRGASMAYLQLFMLGSFASMYHPAGLAMLANNTTPSERSRALGLHGIFGSLGIAAAPFIAGSLLYFPSIDWRGYYLCLGLLCGLLATLIHVFLPDAAGQHAKGSAGQRSGAAADPGVASLQRWPFALLMVSTALAGVVYGGFLHFLKRYLSEVEQLQFLFASGSDVAASRDSVASYLAAMVLVCGAFGQWLAGRIARHDRLPPLLAAVYLANVPFLLWMTVADGMARVAATCLFAFVHFMSQPVYNSLLPVYVPRHQRSTWFGFSNMMGFGVGAVGPWLVGSWGDAWRSSYALLAFLALLAAVMPMILWRYTPRSTELN